jgi:23S rRNA (uracil1939-C5)-methyltransferase
MPGIIHYLTIEKVAMHGYGLGFADGKAVFVPFTMPGDCVNVNVRIEKKDVIFGTVAEYIDASDLSQQPQCDAFGGDNACGGCDWLMAPYRTQVYWKTELIKQVFEPLKLQDRVMPCVPSPQPQHYRNKSFLPAGKSETGLYFGMYERYSHNVIPHKSCLLQPPVMDEILQQIVSFARTAKLEPYNETTQKGVLRHVGIRINKAQDEILLILVTKGSKFPFTKQFVQTLTTRFPQITGIIQNINRSVGNVILGDEDKLLYCSPCLNDILGGVKYRLHYKSFYQVNSATAEKMYSHIKKSLKASDTVLDAFCGAGTIGLYVCGSVKAVHGVEEVPEAIADAEYNRQLNGFSNAEFHLGLVEEVLPELMRKHAFTAVVLDPPRKGVDTASLMAVASAKIPTVIYASCNAMTLARDLKTLLQSGYQVEDITPFDMFPQTWHIETVARLSLPEENRV